MNTLLALCVVNTFIVGGLSQNYVDPFTLGRIPSGPNTVWANHRIPLNNPQCNPTKVYDPLYVFNDSFIVPELDMPAQFPRTHADRLPFNKDFFVPAWGKTYGIEHGQVPFPKDLMATDYFYKVFQALKVKNRDSKQVQFQQCFSKPRPYVVPETAKYIAEKTCRTDYVAIHERAVFHTYNGRRYSCYIPVPHELHTVRCSKPDDPNDNRCKLGYAGYDEFRCVPSNFVQRTVVIVCPEIRQMFKKWYSVPTTCSCKMCYNCGNGITYDVRGPGNVVHHGELNGPSLWNRPNDGIPFWAHMGTLQKK